MRSRLCVVLLALVAACGSDLPPIGDKPVAPASNDPAYGVRAIKDWYLIGDAVTEGGDLLTVFVDPPAGTEYVDVWVGELPPERLSRQSDGAFGGQVELATLAAGTHDVLLAADGASEAFARIPIKRSAPYYVLVTTDWDFSDPGGISIGYQNQMHADHPSLRITHFVGPYTFTDPKVTMVRQQQLVDWLVMNRDTHADEIGLHIHPYCNFVESAGVTCITDQSTVYAEDLTGYTIKVAAYGRTDFETLLAHAGDLFEQHGMNRPRTFRAGGWTASIDTLIALENSGFTADTSALNWARIEEWDGVQNGELYRWNMANWTTIGDTSQPYYPNQTEILSPTAPNLSLLEVPDNGVMIDYVSLDEMNSLFDANWTGGIDTPLATTSVLMMGFHPANSFSMAEYNRVDGFLDYADAHLAKNHLGPVVYVTLADLARVFQ